jgi:hypothetical protein
MRVVALAFALSFLVAGPVVAGCWGTTHTAGTSDQTLTTAEAPIQTPVPEPTKSDG